MYSIEIVMKKVKLKFTDPLVNHLCMLNDCMNNPTAPQMYEVGEYKIRADRHVSSNMAKGVFEDFVTPMYIIHNGETILKTVYKSNEYVMMEFPNDLTADQIDEHLIKLHMAI